MDDIRRPQRRDYALPSQRPDQAPPHHVPQHRPAPPPVHHQPTHQAQPAYHPAHPQSYESPPLSQQPQAAHHQFQTEAHHPPQRAKARLSSKKLSILAAVVLVAAAIFGAGYLLKGSTTPNTIPSSIVSQAKYDLYFPSPMPPGYSYMKDTATFEIGEVFYKFSHGNKRVTVKEEPVVGTPPNLNLLSGYSLFDTSIGKAAIGTSVGETAAMVVTPTTIITMNTIGGVSQQDIKTAINNFQNIGQKPSQ